MESQKTFEFTNTEVQYVQACVWSIRPLPLRNFSAALVALTLAEPWKIMGLDQDAVCMLKASFDNLFGIMAQLAGLSKSTMHNARRAALKAGHIIQTKEGNEASLWTFDLRKMLPHDAIEIIQWLSENPKSALQSAPCRFENCTVQIPNLHRAEKGATYTADCSAEKGAENFPLIDHDHDDRMNDRKHFFSISKSDVIAVAGYSGKSRDECLAILDAYLADAVVAGLADPDERPQLLALFRMIARRHRLPKYLANGQPNPERVQSPGACLRKCWENRHSEDGIDLQDGDTAFARNLLATPVGTVNAASEVQVDPLVEAAIAKRVEDLQALTAEQRRDVAESVGLAFVRKRLLQTTDWSPMMFRDAAKAMIEQEAEAPTY